MLHYALYLCKVYFINYFLILHNVFTENVADFSFRTKLMNFDKYLVFFL